MALWHLQLATNAVPRISVNMIITQLTNIFSSFTVQHDIVTRSTTKESSVLYNIFHFRERSRTIDTNGSNERRESLVPLSNSGRKKLEVVDDTMVKILTDGHTRRVNNN